MTGLYTFKGDNIPALYTTILDLIVREGIIVGPRGLKTLELSPVLIEVQNPRRRMFGHPLRKDVSIFTYIEGLWILKSESKPDRLAHYVKHMGDFVNEKTGSLDGAYGPAINLTAQPWTPPFSTSQFGPNQWDEAYKRLRKDKDTRQAIITINNPLFHTLPTKDYPCTLNFQFLIREGRLDLIVHMRSQDAWWGFIYDTGEFQWFQEIVAGWLGLEVGRYYHFVGSLHLYERNWEQAGQVVEGDKSWTVYDKAEILDARLNRKDFVTTLDDLAAWEESCRLGKFDAIDAWRTPNDFYFNLSDIILACNLRLRGEKEEAFKIVEHNRSDLGLIYRYRWGKE